MSAPCTCEVADGVAVLWIDNPPVNALSTALRRSLLAGIAQAQTDPAVESIVIASAGRTFSAGADISEFACPPEEPSLPAVVDAIEAGPKPVVAAISGPALGGGLELALACHYRIASPTAKLGLPEVTLGLAPGAGGTQRLMRLVDPETALSMASTGEIVDAHAAFGTGLIDRLSKDDLLKDAAAFARETAHRPLPKSSEHNPAKLPDGALAAFLRRNERKFRGREAPYAIIELFGATADMPFREGLALERKTFLHLRESSQSKALRYIFGAERRAAKPREIDQSSARPIHSAGIVGAGTMGTGIAIALLSAGIPVALCEMDAARLATSGAAIARAIEREAAKGRMTREAADRAITELRLTRQLEELSGCDLVVEAIYEDLDAKRAVFGKIGEIVGPETILATNTSYLDIDYILGVAPDPRRSVGLHFFSPANIMKLLEIVRGKDTSAATLASGFALARKLGKVPVLAENAHGFIGNRMLAVRRREAEAMLAAGARPQQVDRVLEDFGFPMGPFRVSDLAGLDIGWDPARSSGATIREVLCEAGRRGQKIGKGYYDYTRDGKPSPSAEVDELLADWAQSRGIVQCQWDDEEILARLLYPMIDDGARILAEGVSRAASDIDVVWTNGYGWPRHKGGPMYFAQAAGLDTICDRLVALGIEPSTALRAAAAANSFDIDHEASTQ